MRIEIFERFLNPGDRASAVVELAARDDAVSVLRSLFSGEARNQFGSPYRDIGALESATEVARRLDSRAKPLEPYLQAAAAKGYPAAISALGQLKDLDAVSVDVLTEVVEKGRPINQGEAVAALVKCGFGDLPVLAAYAAISEPNRRLLEYVREQIGT